MYFSVVVTALCLEAYRQSHIIFYFGGAERKSFLHCGSAAMTTPSPSSTTSPPSGDPDPDVLNVPTNTVPLWALASLLGLMLVYICVFLVNAVTLWGIRASKSSFKF